MAVLRTKHKTYLRSLPAYVYRISFDKFCTIFYLYEIFCDININIYQYQYQYRCDTLMNSTAILSKCRNFFLSGHGCFPEASNSVARNSVNCISAKCDSLNIIPHRIKYFFSKITSILIEQNTFNILAYFLCVSFLCFTREFATAMGFTHV